MYVPCEYWSMSSMPSCFMSASNLCSNSSLWKFTACQLSSWHTHRHMHTQTHAQTHSDTCTWILFVCLACESVWQSERESVSEWVSERVRECKRVTVSEWESAREWQCVSERERERESTESYWQQPGVWLHPSDCHQPAVSVCWDQTTTSHQGWNRAPPPPHSTVHTHTHTHTCTDLQTVVYTMQQIEQASGTQRCWHSGQVAAVESAGKLCAKASVLDLKPSLETINSSFTMVTIVNKWPAAHRHRRMKVSATNSTENRQQPTDIVAQ